MWDDAKIMEDEYPNSSLEAVINAVCTRPHMATHDGRFESIGNFINGFVCGKGPTAHKTLDGFHAWLQMWLAETGFPKSEIPRNYVWQWYIKQAFPEDADAIKNLPLLFKEYLRQSGDAKSVTSD